MIRSQVSKILAQVLKETFPEHQDAPFSVDEPSSGIAADVASNLALVLAKRVGKPPQELAQTLSAKLLSAKDSAGSIHAVDTSKNGFINVLLADKYLRKIVDAICRDNEKTGRQAEAPQGKVLVEFVSANPTGPLHIGHGRGAALGDSLGRIYRQCGVQVQTEYYVNDVGVQMQILAQSVAERLKEIKGEPFQFPDNGYKGDYIKAIARR